jgi:hypothetical protein
MSNTNTLKIEYDQNTLKGLSDHVLVTTQIQTAYLSGYQTNKSTFKPHVIYKWNEGTCVQNYQKSAQSWMEYTRRPEFITGLKELVEDTGKNNE